MISVYILLGVLVGLCTIILTLILIRQQEPIAQPLAEIKSTIESNATVNKEVMTAQTDALGKTIENASRAMTEQISELKQDNKHAIDAIIRTTSDISAQNTENIQAFNDTLHREMQNVRDDMQKQLDVIRKTVDEQLQDNLEKQIQESFRTVSEQLGAVQRGLGEMQNLASNVGDLKKTLSSVKTRGIWGEIQLGTILSEILSPSQYETNVIVVPNTNNRVEYAVRLPGYDNETVYLPIDSKFPGDTYNKLLDAYDSGVSANVSVAWKELESVMTREAKDIHDKYISVPYTTEFGIMFLPVEGLYAEAVKHGMVEKLQKMYKINIAGPTTMAALLNSLQMGFKTLQIQKQSGEVWKILQSTRIEFEKYGDVLLKAQTRLKQTQEEIETLVGVRTRQISSKLSQIEKYTPDALSEGGSS